MKIELKTAPKTFTEKEFIACFYDDENIFYEGLPEQYQKAIINKGREPLLMPISNGDTFGYIYFLSLSSVKHFPRTEAVKILAADALQKAEKLEEKKMSFLVNCENAQDFIPYIAEGVCLGAYRFDRYITKKKDKNKLVEIVNIYCRPKDIKALSKPVEDIMKLCKLVNEARDITNEPGDIATPEKLAQTAKKLSRQFALECDIFDEKRLKKEGYNGLLTVGAASQKPPRMIVLKYKPSKTKSKTHLCIVGKGITFDIGGICIKPPKSMWEMKGDMAGAAAALYIVAAAAQKKIPITVTAVVPAAENAIGSRATLPGAIFKAKNGKTVHVDNTDAEGRLILTDALALAETLNPTHLIDIATLTGSCAMALGGSISGLFGDNPDFNKAFMEAAEEAGELFWELPLHREYIEKLKCDYADLNNIGNVREGGAIHGALFLSEFKPEGVPWIHLDIAGTSLNTSSWKYFRPGATGVTIRTIVRLAERLAST
ncbi:MAG TPA: leucyl aminopeptidase family protein [Candidatus Sumerlaeota bacterium]|nr:MAG: Cytosol aminopeptidase [candidate division BRC1 bacterium ADurb.Bin183]HOE63525.1 leucyl aminopeptidase family protein [Candidatus Sumerlaeota bacterium]HRU53789.1 leucyl aminopeptidase family protein [Candidatus Sumerlaeia bacterium]HON51360.1 leucyl aminopeptidase family protein [Candidatus Sumerlaeota bacterium]HOR64587.1 leucyl aminopeptidase family protein [Candidatus Sumerlaeota bacterium]